MRLPAWLPLWVVRVGLWLALALAAWGGIAAYSKSRYDAGRASVTNGVRFDAVLGAQARTADSLAQAHTDTVIQRITITRWRVETLLVAVPDSLRVVPEIAALMAATKVLAHQVDTLTHALDVERAVGRLRASVDSAALAAAAVTIVHQQDHIVKLERRPRWRTVALALGAGVVAGVLR